MRRTVWVLAAGIALAGCRAPLGPVQPLPATDPRGAALVASLAREAETRRSLRAVARLALDGPAGSGRAKQILVVERPARLRVEILGFLNQTLAVLVTDRGRYRLFRSEDRSLEEGDVYDALLLEVSGVGLRPEQAVDLLLGAPTPPAPLRVEASALLPDGTLRVDGRAASGSSRWRLEFDSAARLRRLEAYAGDILAWEARFDDYRAVGAVSFAHDLELRFPDTRTQAAISFRDVELNPVLPPDIFTLRLPAAPGADRGGRG